MRTYYAHSTDTTDKSDWQHLSVHLLNVAKLAESFADAFNAGRWGRYAGLLHDSGKATESFIGRLEGKSQRVDHSTFGARLARDKTGRLGLLLSYVIAGHHGGIPDGGDQETELHFRLKYKKIPSDIELLPEVYIGDDLDLPIKLSKERAVFSLSLFTRMIFSCLVDADFLDTEAFCSPEYADFRPKYLENDVFQKLNKRFNTFLKEKVRQADSTPVNDIRQAILAQCKKQAELPQQIFSLTVPTGGGKTFSSMAFALEHAVVNKAQRIIYAIPFTSIIEQNAKVFQEALGHEYVLEHHCNYKESDASEDHSYNRTRSLASENWDVPVVVTTNVQFFESLFSNKSSRCRKLHNIARSVIVLDEAQSIPVEYLEPCVAVLRELVDNYGCTVLLCTATQPAFDDSNSLRMAFPEVREIVDDPKRVFKQLRRTEVNFIGKLTDSDLANRLSTERQVLCIVSTKPLARAIFKLLQKEDGLFHLSTNMYPMHRRKVLEDIRTRLKDKKSCCVISTSLVEAGVDLDFPVVYRAMAGLDSIAQAAGRCNREGRMKKAGKVLVFEEEKLVTMPWLKRCITRAGEAQRTMPNTEPLDLEVMRRYFELLYDVQDLDNKQIMKLLNPKLRKELHIPFKETAQLFRFIEDESIGVVVAKEAEARELVQELRYTEYPRSTLRKLQQYSVAVRSKDLAVLVNSGAVEMIHEQYPLLCNENAYDDEVGLCINLGEKWSPDSLIL
jgi:CRISPR-associated endonuclease/helicase Cas3